MIRMGFTGTRDGMTSPQRVTVTKLIQFFKPDEFHHGDCTGSDEQAHVIARLYESIWIVAWPPVIGRYRANCKADVIKKPMSYLARDREISKLDMLVATPRFAHAEPRSGTWITIGYAREEETPIFIVNPSGKLQIIGFLGMSGALI